MIPAIITLIALAAIIYMGISSSLYTRSTEQFNLAVREYNNATSEFVRGNMAQGRVHKQLGDMYKAEGNRRLAIAKKWDITSKKEKE